MRRFWGGTLALAAATVVLFIATMPTPIGFALWHANAAFVAITLAAIAAWPLLARRRVATLAMAASGIVATISGFAMLYTKDMPFKEQVTWWHSVTSYALLLAFLVHWLHNRARLWGFTTRLAHHASGYALALGWIAIIAAGVWTWSAEVAPRFTSANYLYLSSWAVLGGVVLTYGPWLLYRLPALRERLASPTHRNLARALVDVSLFLSHWGALLTGFALLWLATPLRAGPLKYVSKWWHTATSVAFLALLALHVGFNARLLAAHARRVDAELSPEGRPTSG